MKDAEFFLCRTWVHLKLKIKAHYHIVSHWNREKKKRRRGY